MKGDNFERLLVFGSQQIIQGHPLLNLQHLVLFSLDFKVS